MYEISSTIVSIHNVYTGVLNLSKSYTFTSLLLNIKQKY